MKNDMGMKHTNLVIGLLLILFGGGMLLWTVGHVPFIPSILATLTVCFGILFLYLVYFLEFHEFYVFLGLFMIQASIFWMIKRNLPEVYLKSLWPVFLLMSGLTLLPYSLRKKRKRRYIFLVPSIMFILLACLFLPFSLKLIPYGLGDFVKIWWPVLFLFVGGFMSVIHFIRSLKIKRQDTDSR